MKTRKIGQFDVSAIGVGCMSLSHGYGPPPSPEQGAKLLNKALDMGYNHFDTAALYGFGASENLVGQALSARRSEFTLASKCGIFKNDEGKREINGRPEVLRQTLEGSLQRLQTDVIDLYYLHRWDKTVPIEESIGELSRAVEAGKVREIGLSEVSGDTVRKAHAVHPIAAVQNEYSLWSRNPEINTIDACREVGASLIAFSPLARKFLTGKLRDVSELHDSDLRRNMPRFEPQTYDRNLQLLEAYTELAEQTGCSAAQLALAWLLAKGEDIIPIPGTTNESHLEENADAAKVQLQPATVARLDELINEHTVHGPRYNRNNEAEVDCPEFAHLRNN